MEFREPRRDPRRAYPDTASASRIPAEPRLEQEEPLPRVEPDEIHKRLASWRRENGRPAWKPITRPGDGGQLSRFGGSPTLAAGEQWPACRECSEPLQFFLQVELARCPAAIAARGRGL